MARMFIRRYSGFVHTATATATLILTTDNMPSNSAWSLELRATIIRTDGGNHGGNLYYEGVSQNNGGTVTLPTLVGSQANPTKIYQAYDNGFFAGPAFALAVNGTAIDVKASAGDGSAMDWYVDVIVRGTA